MHKTNILKLAEHIETLSSKDYTQELYVSCNSPRCIAGHAVALAERGSLPMDWDIARCKAKAWLGLSEDRARLLFTVYPLLDTEPSAQDAAATLRHLAETGEVDWGRVEE